MSHAYKNLTASGLVHSGPGILRAITLTPAAAVSTATVYDNTAGSGTIICKLQAPANGGSAIYAPPGGIAFGTGCYIALTGASASASALY